MAFFVWKDGFCTGIEALDVQHRNFLECLNEYHERLLASQNAVVDPALIARLQEYAAAHFQLEEALMQSVNYRGVDTHVTQHRFFEQRVKAMDGNRETTNEAVLIWMRDWFLRHILDEDRQFVRYVKFTGLP